MKNPVLTLLCMTVFLTSTTVAQVAISATWDTSTSINSQQNCDPYNISSGTTKCSNSANPSVTGTGFGNSRTYTADGITATVTAWSNTADSTVSGTVVPDSVLQDAYLAEWGSNGLGVMNRDDNYDSNGSQYGGLVTGGDDGEGYIEAPEHAIDNNQRYDSVLFTFNSKVDLSNVSFGYVSGDSDMTVLAYTGTTPLGSNYLSGKTYASLIGNGWTLVGQYTSNSATSYTINNGDIASSYWLIGAYNPTVNNASTTYAGNDNFKIASITGIKYTPPHQQIPEPATIGLLGLGLLGMTQMRRLRKTS